MSFGKGKQPERSLSEPQRAVDDFIARQPDAPVSFDAPERDAKARVQSLSAPALTSRQQADLCRGASTQCQALSLTG